MSATTLDQKQTGWFPLCSISSRRAAHELGLVVLSMRCAYQITPLHDSWYLLEVQGKADRQAPFQIGLYCEDIRKNREAGEGDAVQESKASPWIFVFIACLLSATYWLQASVYGEWWREQGRMDSQLVWQGEWWRVMTPLLLHADIGHLVANLGFGAIFAWFVVRRWGNWAGWWYILWTGILGNTLTAATYQWLAVPHWSIGASTAVMGAIGLLAGASAWEKRHERNIGIGWLGPVGVSLFGGIALFALLGVGGERTDIVAHLCGWLSGILLGYAMARRQWKSGCA